MSESQVDRGGLIGAIAFAVAGLLLAVLASEGGCGSTGGSFELVKHVPRWWYLAMGRRSSV